MLYFLVNLLLIPVASLYTCCLLWRYYNWTLRDTTSKAPLPPGSFGLPLIGETYLFIFLKTRFFDSKVTKHGPIYKTHLFGSPTIRVTIPDDIRTILRDERQNLTNAWPKSAHLLLQGGLALETSDIVHRSKRKVILQAFSHEALSRYVPIMLEICTEYVKRWMLTSDPVYLYPELRNLTFHVVGRCLLGICPSQDDLSQIINLFGTFVNGLFSLPFQIPGFSFYKAMKARQKLLNVIDIYLDEQREINNRTETSTIFGSDWNATSGGDVTADDIKNICLELLFAGHESTASAASTMVINICKYPKAFEDMRKEVNDVKVSELTYDIINNLTYFHSVVKESLRLNPPIGAGYRRVVKTFTCQGYQVPKGWTLIYGIRESHRNSSMTSSPETFTPERWFSEEWKLREEFLTFGAGRRKCVGRHFAELFLKVFLIVLVQNCKVRPLRNDLKLDYFPVPHPTDNLLVTFDEM